MKTSSLLYRSLGLCSRVAAIGLLAGAAQASTNVFDFNTDPAAYLNIRRGGDNATLSAMAGAWFPSGGSPLEAGIVDPSTNGYFAITQTTPATDTQHGMRSVIVFDDFDSGLVVAGFTFACDVRIGGGNATPADGFSLNFARDTDPAIFSDTFASGPDGNPANAPEEGTTTGLTISFDAFGNTGNDPIGLTIKSTAPSLRIFPCRPSMGLARTLTRCKPGRTPPGSPTCAGNRCWSCSPPMAA